jgi:hypothetical protein
MPPGGPHTVPPQVGLAPVAPGPPLTAPPLAGPPAPPLIGKGRRIRSHGRRRRVPVWTVLLLVLGLAAVGAGLRFVPGSPFAPERGAQAGAPLEGTLSTEATPSPTPEPDPLPFRPATITAAALKTKGFLSWAILDRRSGDVVGSANMAQNSTSMSMIKAWFAADDLRLTTDRGKTPSQARLNQLEVMIRDSDNGVAENLYFANGKANVIKRLVQICDLEDAKAPANNRFGYTQISARDAVRMGACIADGRAAGSKWTPWLLDMMRKVRGTGNFGIRNALPEVVRQTIAIKNGWDFWNEDRTFRTNCLAIGDTWVVTVMQRYPTGGNAEADFAHTRKICQETAKLLLNPDAF